MKRLIAIAVFSVASLASLVAHASLLDDIPDQEAMHAVWVYIDHQDCAGAIKELNKGIEKKQRDVLLMAGTMFEEGICLKQNWTQAASMYQRAYDAGNKSGLPRLISGYAVEGREPATAIWWAAQDKWHHVSGCLPKADPLTETDAFVAEISKWAPSRVEQCAYAYGVWNTVMGDMEYPGQARDFAVSGTVLMDFNLAKGTINWKRESESVMSSGLHYGEHINDQGARAVKKSLLTYAQSIGERALKRYKHPEGIDADWNITMTYNFDTYMKL